MLEIGRLARRKAPIVDKAAASKRLSKYLLLKSSGIEPVLVGPLRLLAHGLFALSLFLDVLFNGSQDFPIERAIMLFGNRSYLFQQGSREPNGECFYLIFHVAILILIWLHVKRLTPLAKARLKKGPSIPESEGRGFTSRFDKPAHELHASARVGVAQPIFARAVTVERTIGHTLKVGQSLESMITSWSQGESHEESDESHVDQACNTSFSRQPESVPLLEHNQTCRQDKSTSGRET
jgi:hypothetical protein